MSSLQETFEPKRNALNAVRLVLAIGVIAWHSFPLTGNDLDLPPGRQLLANVFVDGFFAISGFLIVSSWTRNPRWWPYLKARLLRIMPAYYVCLIITAAVFAPVSVLLAGGTLNGAMAGSSLSYIAENAFLKQLQYGIDGTLTDVPYPDVWNGSLWTLFWEFLCYLGVLVLGLLNLLRYRLTLPLAFVGALIAMIAVTIHPTGQTLIDPAPRFATMFLAGALIFQFRTKLPASWKLVAAATAVVVIATAVPNYRIPAALPLAYALITLGALIKAERLRLPNDLSYGIYIYAFPVQQLVATVSAGRLGIGGFFVVSTLATLPLAAASWYAVERPALRLKKRRRGPTAGDPAQTVPSPAATP